jgi:hypothetical protein
MEDLAARVDAALREEEPAVALHNLVRALLTEGYSRKQLTEVLEDYRRHVSDYSRDLSVQRLEDDDDRILDVIAVLSGWASSTAERNLMPPPCVAPHATSLS